MLPRVKDAITDSAADTFVAASVSAAVSVVHWRVSLSACANKFDLIVSLFLGFDIVCCLIFNFMRIH